MPKHGFKWRTEQLRLLSPEALYERFIFSSEVHYSAKLARWVYENLATAADSSHLRIAILDVIGFDEEAPWSRKFLWKELERHKDDHLGDWVVVALTRLGHGHPNEFERFVALYEDQTAHYMTRGSAVFGVCSASFAIQYHESGPGATAEQERLARETCAKALRDESNPYARAGACWLAKTLGGFEDELERLREDKTELWPHSGTTVADHVND